jgi:hypothetical protein
MLVMNEGRLFEASEIRIKELEAENENYLN